MTIRQDTETQENTFQASKWMFGPGLGETTHETVVTRADQPLYYVIGALLVLGLVFVYSASAHQALEDSGNSLAILFKQVLATGIGLTAMTVLSGVNFQIWRKLAQPIALCVIVLLLLTMVVGTTANGSERWIPLPGGFQMQPSDLAKIAAVTLMAQSMAGAQKRDKLLSLNLIINLMLIGAMIFLVYQQPNLSVSVILAALTFVMIMMGGMPLYILLAIPPVLWAVWHKIRHTEYQWRRITGWLEPWKDPQDTGYNLIQSYYAIGSGGFFGVGLFHSVQKLYYLPFQHTDFIFAVICEELGFCGAMMVLGLFGMLAWRGFSIALHCPSPFGQMLAFGITFSITLQALINIAVTVGVLPVTGVTLPLISYGGTSMIVTLGMLGILLNISRYKLAPRILEKV